MILNARQQEIMQILKAKGSVSVGELSTTLYASEMTIRRDLTEMEKGGFLRRYRGGAVLKINLGEMPIKERLLLYKEEKEALAKKCLPYLKDDIAVFIDSSSTCQYLLPHIAEFKNITVVTNSVSSLLTASGMHLNCILVGGEYYEQDMCMVGSIAEEQVKNLNVDVAFLTTAGISHEGVITDFDLKQTAVRKIIIKNSKRNVFLFEKEKIGKKFLYTLCDNKDSVEILTVE